MIKLNSCQSEDAGEAGENETEVANASAIETIRRDLIQHNTTCFCQICKEEIPKIRRDFLPGCLFCIKCQAEIDSGRKTVGREEMTYEVTDSETEPVEKEE